MKDKTRIFDTSPPMYINEAMSYYKYLKMHDNIYMGVMENNEIIINVNPEKCLQDSNRAKKQMYLEACLQQHRYFSPFVALVDGLVGVEATATLKRIASFLSKNWQQPYFRTCGYIKTRISITLVGVTHRCIQGSRVTSHWISVQLPQWEYGAGLNLLR